MGSKALERNSRPFLDKEKPPAPASLAIALDEENSHWKELLKLTETFQKEWRFSKDSGWMLKISDSNKLLLYAIPLYQSFRISMAVRDMEREHVLKEKSLQSYHSLLLQARKYPEGNQVQFDISSSEEYKNAHRFILQIIAFRKMIR